ncbi:MAG: hypothetical protein ACMUHX_09800 [bacterium]
MIKRVVFFMVVIIVMLSAINITKIDAMKRSLGFNDVLNPKNVLSWRTEINGKYFNVVVDRENKTVTVKGSVSDYYEMDLVKRHFDLRSPSDYRIIHRIDFADESTSNIDFAD